MTRQPRDTEPLCPVCRKPVAPTKGRNIYGHLDKAGHPCPGTGINYEYALTDHLQPPGGAA